MDDESHHRINLNSSAPLRRRRLRNRAATIVTFLCRKIDCRLSHCTSKLQYGANGRGKVKRERSMKSASSSSPVFHHSLLYQPGVRERGAGPARRRLQRLRLLAQAQEAFLQRKARCRAPEACRRAHHFQRSERSRSSSCSMPCCQGYPRIRRILSGETCADAWIEKEVAALRDDGCPKFWVVTSDHVQQHAAHGAIISMMCGRHFPCLSAETYIS